MPVPKLPIALPPDDNDDVFYLQLVRNHNGTKGDVHHRSEKLKVRKHNCGTVLSSRAHDSVPVVESLFLCLCFPVFR